MIKIKVFDFDNTIYQGESAIDFFLYIISKNKHYTKYLPLTIYSYILYKTKRLPLDYVKKIADKYAHEIVNNKNEFKELVHEFWIQNSKKLKPKFLEMISEDDIIITGSPNILIDEIKDKLNTKNIICSQINLDTGDLEFLCLGKNKSAIFQLQYPNARIDELYTDSMNDKPLINISKKAYLVKGDEIKEIAKPKKRIRRK